MKKGKIPINAVFLSYSISSAIFYIEGNTSWVRVGFAMWDYGDGIVKVATNLNALRGLKLNKVFSTSYLHYKIEPYMYHDIMKLLSYLKLEVIYLGK